MDFGGSIGRMLRISRAAAWVAFLLLGSSLAWSQMRGSLRGSITDPSGAAIPNASVHLINAATHSDRTATTNAHGIYTFQEVAPGTYRLLVEAPGFEKYEQDDLRLQTSAPATLDVKMKIGEVQANVTVTGQMGDQCIAAQARILPDVGPGLRAIRRGPSGNYYILTAPGAAAAIYSPDGTRIGQVPAAPSPDSSIVYGSDLQVDSTGRVYIADRAANAIKIYAADGTLARKIRVAAPISVEPLADGEVAASSLSSKHLVDVYDQARGEVYRSFGDIDNTIAADCDPATLRCTAHTASKGSNDASHLTDAESSLNRAWFYGDSAGNVYVNLADVPKPTIRKYDGYGYLAFESSFPVTQPESIAGNAGWNIRPEVRLAGVGTIGATDDGSTSNSTNNSTSSSGDPTSATGGHMSGGRPMMGGGGGMRGMGMEGGGEGMPGGMHGGGMRGGGMNANRITFGVGIAQHGASADSKPSVDAMGVDAESQEVWAAVGGDLVEFDKDGKLAGDYCLSTADKAPVRPVTILVEPNRILLGTDPFGIFIYPRPDKQEPNPASPR